MSVSHSRARRRTLITVAPAALFALVLAASPAGAQTSSATPQFAMGAVTSIHGASVQVTNQNQNRESTVVLSPTTQVSKRVTATAAAVTVGACVSVTGTGSATKGITARSVALSAATSNGCTGGPGGLGTGGGTGRFRFGNGQRPRNFGNGNGPGGGFRNGGRAANFALASGPVVSISGDKMVVKSTTFTRPTTANAKNQKGKTKNAKAKATNNATPKTTTSNVTVTLPSSAAITQTVAGATSDVAVGSCVTATGTTDAGSVDATRVVVSQPVNGSCTAGFGLGGRGPGSAGGAV